MLNGGDTIANPFFSIKQVGLRLSITVSNIPVRTELEFYLRFDPDPDADLPEGEKKPFYKREGVIATSVPFTYTIPKDLELDRDYAINVKVDKTSWIGKQVFTATEPESERPDDWDWWSTISRGYPVSISAYEWNAFCSVINDFRAYKGLSASSFTTVYSGTKISASIVNQARSAISGISGHGTLPSPAVSGNAMTANFFLTLSSALNAVT